MTHYAMQLTRTKTRTENKTGIRKKFIKNFKIKSNCNKNL